MRVSTLFLGIVFFVIVAASAGSSTAPASASIEADWTQSLGREDRIAYIAMDELQTDGGVDFSRGLTFDDFKPALATFYEKFNWAPNNCWAGSVLKKGVKAYCLPYARLGKHGPSAYDPNAKVFSGISNCAGLYVWHIPEKNQFYLWGLCWNAPGVLGPFVGDPKISLPRAIKPRRGQRSFPGVTLTVVSQRWLYPNPQDARVPRDDHYDCAHGHMSGRAMETLRLSTFITRLRLANSGSADLFYQTETEWVSKPAICPLLTDREDNWELALKIDYQCDIGGRTWRKLGAGEAVEFEKTDQAYKKGFAGFVLLLNEEPNYWDPGKLLGTYPVMFGR